MAKMVKMALMAVMEWYDMAINMAIIGVYRKSRKNIPLLEYETFPSVNRTNFLG